MRNIIITGGELFNKGAQAMTFIAVDELHKRFPNHKIYLLSEMDNQKSAEEKGKYNFDFFGWFPPKFIEIKSNPFKHFVYSVLKSEYKKFYDIYNNCDLMIDISGYALASKFDKAYYEMYLDHIEFAKAFNIPVYLMPQSFGPFDFEDESIVERVKIDLSYIKTIMAREQDGYDLLTRENGLNNVILCKDIVLCNKGVDLNNIFKSMPEITIPEISNNSVGLIPNAMTLKIVNENELLTIYKKLIEKLIDNKKSIYLIRHSTQDYELCKKIKALFESNSNVILLKDDFQCYEFNEIVKKMDFIVGSRFHSIVHALKNGIPCISMGWADKYNELMAEFEQSNYSFDLREDIDISAMCDAAEQLDINKSSESNRILTILSKVQEENAFDNIIEV